MEKKFVYKIIDNWATLYNINEVRISYMNYVT